MFGELWLLSPAVAARRGCRAQLRVIGEAGVGGARAHPEGAHRARGAPARLGGLIERARSEAEALVAEKLPADVAERALRVLMNASRRLGRDDAALAAVTDGLAVAPADRRAGWLLELGRLQQRRTASRRSPRSTSWCASIRRAPTRRTRSC